jgi:hypothetical protein
VRKKILPKSLGLGTNNVKPQTTHYLNQHMVFSVCCIQLPWLRTCSFKKTNAMNVSPCEVWYEVWFLLLNFVG